MRENPPHTIRVFVECSHTAASNINTGIQRVVRNIVEEWQRHKYEGLDIIPVIIENGQFVKLTHLPDLRYQEQTVAKSTNKISVISVAPTILKQKLLALRTALVKFIPGKALKRFITAPRQEMGLTRIFITLVTPFKSYLAWRYRKKQQQHNERYADFKQGDVLLMLDSSWHYPIAEITKNAQQNGCKVISVIYDLIPVRYPEFCMSHLTHTFEGWLDEAGRVSDGFIAISQTVQYDLLDWLSTAGRPFDVEKTGYFYLGADLAKPKGETRQELKNTINAHNSFLIVCTIEPRKNHHFLLDVFEKLWQQGLDINLHIVGRIGWHVDELMKRIKRHPEYNQHLYMWHDLNDAELIYSYQNSKALIFPSIVEGFGLPLIEAQYYTLPVLASDTPIHREVGADSIEYFSLENHDDLYQKLTAIHSGEMTLPEPDVSRGKQLTWKNSANQLLDEVRRIYHQIK